jgi:ABC-type Fe3+-hydroxamate transport system substrate-binding protein
MRLARLALLLLCPLALLVAATSEAEPVRRVVSVNPSLTAILVELGAADALVGVDDYSGDQIRAVAHLPRVGGLFNPSLESVVALRPDAVVLVPSAEQRDFRERLAALGVRVVVFDNIRFDEVLENISRLGALVGREREAEARVTAIRQMRGAVARVVARRPSPRVILVLQRDPLFIVGTGSFIAEMVDAVGAANLGGEFEEAYPQVAIEWLVARAPDFLIDLSLEPDEPLTYWSRWPSLPAVARGHVLRLDPALVSMPGPRLDRSLETLATGLYGAGIEAEIRRELAP